MAKLVSELAKGAWSIATAYTPGDFVTHGGASYVCIANSTGNEPPNVTYWALVASKGDTGLQGTAGEEVLLQVSGGYIQWKYTSDVSWTNLIAVATLKGDTGDTGPAGTAIELQKTATHVQWRYVGGSWTDLIALTDITGPQGNQGIQGNQGDPGTSFVWKGAWSGATAYVANDVVSSNGSSYVCILGHTNQAPPNITYWSLVAQKGADGEGVGDVVGPVTNNDSYIPQWDGVDSKTLKNGVPTSTFASALGVDDNYVTDAEKVKLSNLSGTNTGDQTLPVKATGAEINTGTDDAKFATPKAIADSNLAFLADITDAQLSTSDVTTNDVSTAKHGFVPKAPNDTAKFLRGDGTWNTPASGSADGWTAAGETWTYASADDPTFTFTVAGVDLTTKYYPGMRIKLTQTTAKYFIITKVAFSTDTTITVYGGTDYDLADATITNPYYSVAKAPAGFPLDPAKWTVEASSTTNATQATPTANTWYNLGGSIAIPLGIWEVEYHAALYADIASGTTTDAYSTLSTANNSESDVDFTNVNLLISGSAANTTRTSTYRRKVLTLAAKATYYLNAKTSRTGVGNIQISNADSKLIIRARCAYL